MEIDEPHHVITSSETGKSQKRNLLTLDEVVFTIRMGLMKSSGLSGIRGRARSEREATLATDVAEQFRLSGYMVFSRIGRPVPIEMGKLVPRSDED
jgi:hypothetical protein